MNILIVVPWYKPTIGGVVLYIEKLCYALQSHGHKLNILTPGDSNSVEKIGSDGTTEIYSFNFRPIYSAKAPLRSFLAWSLFLIPTLRNLKKFLDHKKIDLVFISYPSGYELCFAILRRLFSIKYAVIIHGSEINLLPNEPRPIINSIKHLISHAEILIASSDDLLNTARQNLKKLPKRYQVIYMGIDPNWQNTNRQDHVIDGKYMLTLAWATRVKGPDIVIQAFSRISGKFQDVKLVMVGGGPMENELGQLIEQLGLSDRVIRLGTLDSSALPSLFRNSLIGIIPSRSEGFGIVMLEFQLMKKGIIATNVGGIPEFVTDNYNGYLVPADDIESMASKMEHLLENPDLAREMGERGYKRVLESFLLNKTGREFDRVIREIISG